MFGLPLSLILKLGGAALVLAIIGFHFAGDRHTHTELIKAQTELVQTQAELKQANDNLIAATKARDEYLKAGQEADKARVQVQADLQVTIKKLRAQKPPVECKAAIDWAVDNKQDLDWQK